MSTRDYSPRFDGLHAALLIGMLLSLTAATCGAFIMIEAYQIQQDRDARTSTALLCFDGEHNLLSNDEHLPRGGYCTRVDIVRR